MIKHTKNSPSKTAILAGVLALTAVGAAPASANTVTFAFGSLANNATDAQIQSLMNSLLPAGDSVTVTGTVGSNSYNGDGHVTGSGNGNTSFTLANMDSAGNGTFIQNDTGHSSNDILSRQSRNQTGDRGRSSASAVRAILDDPPIHIRPDLPAARVQSKQTLWV